MRKPRTYYFTFAKIVKEEFSFLISHFSFVIAAVDKASDRVGDGIRT